MSDFNTVDLQFPIRGVQDIPYDHAYDLYGGLSRIIPELHQAKPPAAWRNVGIMHIQGENTGNRTLRLTDKSSCTIRTSMELAPHFFKLANQGLQIGDLRVQVTGFPTIRPIEPSTWLRAWMVYFNQQTMEESSFLASLHKAVGDFRFKHATICLVPQRTKDSTPAPQNIKRSIRMHQDTRLCGWAVEIGNLDRMDSLRLQTLGLGGKRHFGCGIFTGFEPAKTWIKKPS